MAIIIIAAVLVPMLSTPKAAAATIEATFIDRAHIRITRFQLDEGDLSADGRNVGLQKVNELLTAQVVGKVFSDTDISDNNNEYRTPGCDRDLVLNTDSTEGVDRGEMRFDQFFDLSLNNNTPIGNPNIGLGCFYPMAFSDANVPVNTDKGNIWFNFVDPNTIRRVDGDGGTYKNNLPGSSDAFRYVATGGSSRCPNDVKAYAVTNGPINGTRTIFYDSCDAVGSRDVVISATNTVPEGAPGSPGGAGATEVAPSCESEGGEMSWLVCPVLNAIDGAVRWIDETIASMLEVDPAYIDRTNPGSEGLYQAWGRMRSIAYLILVPITLVMVISTALGFEFFSAYAIKRALPRLLVAVIFIALSWNICTFLILFFNAIGAATQGLITATVAGANEITLGSLFTPSTGDSIAFGGFATLVAGAGLGLAFAGIVTSGILISFGVGLLLPLLGAFVALLLRQLVLIFLIIFAPLAILAWIFPGNDKLWNIWRTTFSTLLIFYPLAMGLLGVAKVFTKIISQLP